MQFLFKRRKTPKSHDTVIIGTLAEQLEKGYLFIQGEWAQWMTKKTANVSFSCLLVIWVFCVASAAGYSMYLIVNSLSGTTTNSISVTPMVTPLKLVETGDAIHQKNSFVSKNQLEKIIRFQRYLDSLARSPTGKKTFDSILNNRPGLLDSLVIIENYYQSNFKNHNHGKRN